MPDEQQNCVHCGVEVRLVPYALGDEWMHSPYPGHTRNAYRFCQRTVATPPDHPDPVQLELDGAGSA